MVNPWGGVEAMLTHAVSILYDKPSAHAPMMESTEIANLNLGVVDPRIAAETVSATFLQCVLKGLHRSPAIISDSEEMRHPDVVTARDVSCVVIPDGCVGLVNSAISGYTTVIFLHPGAAKEPRAPVVARFGIEFHHTPHSMITASSISGFGNGDQ